MSTHWLILCQSIKISETTENDTRSAKKVLVSNWLDAMRNNNRSIFSALANEYSNRGVDGKQSAIEVFRLFGGMDDVR